jgi:hypothetical protein
MDFTSADKISRQTPRSMEQKSWSGADGDLLAYLDTANLEPYQ